ncbi:Hypothetical predicted protein [Octopus vulgaris]|uniref:Uncharacterized protein n=2 Tax=Octopus TaxID=6643 RepID=A0AA36BDQ5_OCTVU|nr:Hypothetical predicted protein [Octopus vulgaris]
MLISKRKEKKRKSPSITCQSHIDHDNMEYHLHMEIWKGNITTALTWAKEREELSDWLVAMAPLASHGTWLTVCEDYAYQLESDGEYHKAVTYLVACHRIYEAIDLFKRHRLFKEAVTFAKVRLSPVDPVFEDLYSMWAQQLAKEGNYEQAAKCYLAIKQVQDASRCLTKRTDHVCMRTAAHISLLAMEKQNGLLLAQRVIHQYLQKMQYQEAYNFTQEHSNLKVFTLVISMHELMMSELLTLMPSVVYAKDSSVFVLHKRRMTSLTGSKTLLPDFILDSNDIDPLCPWKPYLINKHTFFNHVLRSWHQCLDVDLESSSVEDMYKIFNTLISGRQSFVNIDQLLMQNCMDLTLCMLSLLQGETTAAIKHLLQAMVNLHDASQYQLLQIISQLCLPQGPKYLLKLQQEVTAVRVLITIDKSGDDLSKLDTTLKMNTTKRYLSDLKDDNQVFNSSLRCRELDCVRAYYYIGVLRYLFDRQQSLESKTIPSQQSAVSKMVHTQSRTDEDNNPYTLFQPLHELESMNQTQDNSPVEKTNNNNSSGSNNNNNIADSHSDGINTNQNNNKQTSNNQECCYDNRARTDFKLTFHKFRYLSKCLLWDIQGKRFALTEKLGYIHRAISQLLLEQKPKNDKTDSGTILCEKNGKSNSNNENFQKTEDIPSQENVRLQTPDLIPTGHETSIPSPLQSGASSPTEIKELPLPINEILVDEPSAHVPNVSHCLSPCQEDEPYKAVTKPRKVLWKDELPASNHLCPLHRKYVNVPDVWYDYTVDEKYTKPYVTMAILQDEQELVMSELKQGPENPTQILFPRPLSSAQLLLTVIWNCEDFDRLEKTQLIDETVSWALKYSLTSAQQKIFHNLKDQMKI